MEYLLCGEAIRLVFSPASGRKCLAEILERLFALTPLIAPWDRGIEISIEQTPEPMAEGEVVFDSPGLTAIRMANGYHLRTVGSFLSLDPGAGRATGWLSRSFMNASAEDQRGLFFFAFLLLLSMRGLYALHAAGVERNGRGYLLVAGSGSGKTTLTCALTRSGWQYLSDDSVLLKRGASGVEALAYGRPFHCGRALRGHFPELAGGAPAAMGGKRLVDVELVYPGRFRGGLRPEVILFPEIVDARTSRLEPLGRTATLARLLGEGAGFIPSPEAMAAQMSVLGELAQSARGFRLMHGADVHSDPGVVAALLEQIGNGGYGDAVCCAA